jgi:hypothetical protein
MARSALYLRKLRCVPREIRDAAIWDCIGLRVMYELQNAQFSA